MPMHKVLLVWQAIPEEIDLYEIVATDEEFEKLRKCHRNYVGGDLPPDLATWIQLQLNTYTECGDPEGPWGKCLRDSKVPYGLTGDTTVILSGWFM